MPLARHEADFDWVSYRFRKYQLSEVILRHTTMDRVKLCDGVVRSNRVTS